MRTPNAWDQVDAYARSEADKRLRALGWRLTESSRRNSWAAYRIEGAWSSEEATNPETLLEKVTAREKDIRAFDEEEAAWTEWEMAR